ncbi:AGAP000108-PA-like protein [Anopheles sinensis]|uniref:AGAP000108-PA-like protein n=1 Tax=Anopheles sinensis TaxID=74873 RepID=A0A084WFK7_ANOSI|nr:AGAP000108-PA-like protein [Anopheles sinensis]
MSSGSVLLLTVLLIGYIYWSLAQPTNIFEIRCKLKKPVKDAHIVCPHGVFIDPCGMEECIRGPGDLCGNTKYDIVLYGQCDHDLLCCNSRCRGCTAQGVCFDEPCHPPKQHGMQHRSDPYMPLRNPNPLYALLDYYGGE